MLIVPPVEELEILDPRVDPQGKPRALVVPLPEGGQRIEIPPTVIVHKFYYTGNREFQGPLLPGGPTILVVNHPRKNERLYVEVQLLPGIPRIKYFHNSIIYDYGAQSILIKFGVCGDPKVVVCQGHGWREHTRESAEHMAERTHEWMQRTRLPEIAAKLGRGARNAGAAVSDRIGDVNSTIVLPFVETLETFPASDFLTSTPEERAARLRDVEVQGRRTLDELEATIPTVR